MIKVLKESVVYQDSDAIVNAANSSLLGGGGVDGAIHNAAGPNLLEECQKLHGCKTGGAKITHGYNLKAKYIIHTVGPIYSNADEDEDNLKSCYINCLNIAKAYCLKSISFCGISTGVYGYPLKDATRIAIKTVKEWLDYNKYDIEVRFCCFKDIEYQTYIDFLEEIK